MKQLTLLAGYSSIVVLEICIPPNTEAAAPQNLQPWLRAWIAFCRILIFFLYCDPDVAAMELCYVIMK